MSVIKLARTCSRVPVHLVVVLLLIAVAGPGCKRQGAPPRPPASPVPAAKGSQAMLEAGDQLFRSRSYGEARRAYQEAAEAAEEEGHPSTRIEALAQVARTYSITGEGEKGEPWLNQAAALARESEPLGWSRYRLVLGVFQREAGRRELATQTFIELYEYCLAHELHERAVNAAHMVAIAADLETQVGWGKKGIAAAEAGGHDEWLGPLWNNLGWTYDDLGRYEESLQALITAREYHYRGESDHAKLVADWSVGHAHRMVGEPEIAREWLRDVHLRATRRYEGNRNAETAEWVGHAAKELAELNADEGKRDEAYQLMREALARLKEAGMPKWDPAGFDTLVAREKELRRAISE